MDSDKGKRTGKVAKIFGIDQKTVTRWTDEFAEFFSTDAQGMGRTQRAYHEEDLIIFNTIHKERTQNGSDPEKIRAILVSGERDTQLPPEAITVEGDKALSVYIELNTLRAKLETAENEIERLQTELDSEREGKEKLIADLNREIGKWQAMAEMYKEQLKGQGED